MAALRLHGVSSPSQCPRSSTFATSWLSSLRSRLSSSSEQPPVLKEEEREVRVGQRDVYQREVKVTCICVEVKESVRECASVCCVCVVCVCVWEGDCSVLTSFLDLLHLVLLLDRERLGLAQLWHTLNHPCTSRELWPKTLFTNRTSGSAERKIARSSLGHTHPQRDSNAQPSCGGLVVLTFP